MAKDDEPNPNQERLDIASQALKFLGLMLTIAGALAILRTGEKSLLFVIMMPAGLVMWGVGMWLRSRMEAGRDE